MGPDVPARPLTTEEIGDLPATAPDVPAPPLTTAEIGNLPAPCATGTPRTHLLEFAEAVLVAVVLALFVRTFLLQAFVVPSPSMEKTLLIGDHVIVNKFLFAPHALPALDRLLPRRPVRRGDVIVFKFPEDPRRDFVKRAVALPADRVEIRDKTVFVNGQREFEPRALHTDPRVWSDERHVQEGMRRRDQSPPFLVPARSYFALGDNRDNSYDSRFWGFVPSSHLKGRPLFVYWSHPPGGDRRRPGPVGWIADFFAGTRWSRTLLPVR
jgi:signal peptidase I